MKLCTDFCVGRDRWNFLLGDAALHHRSGAGGGGSGSRTSSKALERSRLSKKLLHHKQQLQNIEAMKAAAASVAKV